MFIVMDYNFMQSSKKTKNVQDPNLCLKLSDFRISLNNSQKRLIILMNIGLKPLFIKLWSISIKLCFIFNYKMSKISKNGIHF
jgi:hypothetical protein